MNLIPFQAGDAFGKRNQALSDAQEQGARQEPMSMRAKLYALQAAATELEEVDMPLQHVFAPGVYARTIFIPAGTFVVGKIHKHQHVNILSMGSVSVMTEEGGIEDLTGPLTMMSPAGCKRALYTHTDTVWTTIHPTNETDLEKIEDFVIAKTYEEYEQFLLRSDEPKKQIEVTAWHGQQ